MNGCARALDNNIYVIGMNLGTYYLDRDSTTAIDTFSGVSQIVDYREQVTREQVELLQERGIWARPARSPAPAGDPAPVE
jgi:predicted amidohydrolase